MKQIKIAIVGYRGKMGSAVFDALKQEYEVVGIDRGDYFADSVSLVIDFASAESSATMAKECARRKIPLIIGSTGQDENELNEIKKASEQIIVLMAGNFSLGICLLKNALTSLITNNVQDIVIFEKHHKDKKDAPSGTAKEIKHFIENNFNMSSDVVFERGGKEIGTHVVDIYYENEVISLSHRAFSRNAFVDGLKKAIKFVLGSEKSGFYNMHDVKM